MEQVASRPRVGVGVLIFDNDKILLGKRKSLYGRSLWAPPGGHLEFGESWQVCAQREVAEETGLILDSMTFFHVTNNVFYDTRTHYVSIFMMASYNGGEITNCEPEKCEQWQWFDVKELPESLFYPLATLLEERALTFHE